MSMVADILARSEAECIFSLFIVYAPYFLLSYFSPARNISKPGKSRRAQSAEESFGSIYCMPVASL